MPMITKNIDVLNGSADPRELVDMARAYAMENSPDDQNVVLRFLSSRGNLLRLNTEQEYIMLKPRGLNASRILKTLMDAGHEPALRTLRMLTEAPEFQSFHPLAEINIFALAADRPASLQTIRYWGHHSHHESSTIDLVIEAVMMNRSTPALEFFVEKMNESQQDPRRRTAWLRDPLLRWRNDADLLRFCGWAMTRDALDAEWHSPLLEALFDYNVAWYLSCEFPHPPPRAKASPDSLNLLGHIGEWALTKGDVTIPGLSAKIRLVLKEIGHEWDDEDQPA